MLTFRSVVVKHIEFQSFLGGGFYGYSKYLKSFFIYKQTQEIDDKQVPKYDFNK